MSRSDEAQSQFDKVENLVGETLRELETLEGMLQELRGVTSRIYELAEALFNDPEKSAGEIEEFCREIMELIDD